MHKVGIIGHGFVGLAVETGLQLVADIRIYDKYKNTESLQSVVDNSNVLFICVPTPMEEDGSCNISIVEEVVDDIDEISEAPKTIVIKSTVPPGTTAMLAEKYEYHNFIFNPEHLTEANFIEDFLNQDRIVLGYTRPEHKTNKDIINLYIDFIKNVQKEKSLNKIIETTSEAAEMSKYVINSFLATKVIFFNEIYEICKEIKLDFEKVTDLVLLDKRIGHTHYKVPGPDGKLGFSKSCFPKDINALAAFAENLYLDPLILNTVWLKNLYIRENHDWLNLPQMTGKYNK